MTMEKEQVQRIATLLFNEELPAFITTYSDSWISGYILEFDGLVLVINDRKKGKMIISVDDIRIIKQFTGDLSTLRRDDG